MIMAERGALIDGKYEILKEIGRGGMSVVYLAMDNRLNKQWAVKEIRKKGNSKSDEIVINSLLAEADLMKKLDHPALPRIVDIVSNAKTIYIIMDYIEGRSLDVILKEQGASPEALVILWAKQLVQALRYLHSQNPPIIYRDMKPSNIMLKPDGIVKIIDFGIAREYREKELSDTTVLGTKGYAPPEQYNGRTDKRSDIFSLGMTMYSLITGRDPIKGDIYVPVRQIDRSLSEGIELIIDKCVQPAAKDRYQSCEELLRDLEHPNLLTDSNKRQMQRRIRVFKTSVAFMILFTSAGTIFRFIGTDRNNKIYKTYIETTNADPNERIGVYRKAVLIYPQRIDAYMKILECFEEEGSFKPSECRYFTDIYDSNKDGMDKSSDEYAELNYKAGMMFYSFYTNEDGSENIAGRINNAYRYFKDNHENPEISAEFKYKNLSECYYSICEFYKKYIFDGIKTQEVSKAGFDELIAQISEVLKAMDNNEDSYITQYDRMAVYNGIFCLLYDLRIYMAQTGVDKEIVLGILQMIYENTSDITLNKQKSKKIKAEIESKYSDYKEAIERAYENVQTMKKWE